MDGTQRRAIVYADSLIREGAKLVGINLETHQALVWSGRQAAAVVTADLMEILQDKERMK